MKIIIDDKIPYIKGALEPFAEVVYLPGSQTTPEVVKEADALITRTRTRCNRQLLEGSNVKFIATATIGFDHIDTEYCREAGIQWTNAPGCNSGSVEQYIASALAVLSQKHNFSLSGKTIGIVGVGNVGKKVARIAEAYGMKVLLNDPPRERAEGKGAFVSLAEILEQSDIITLHVPLNMTGEDKTFHLVDDAFFAKAKKKPFVINSCRGEVVETEALKKASQANQIAGAVIDCWENEPDIDRELLDRVDIATPHIAGYSKDGKANGTAMSVQAVSRFFGLGIDDWSCQNVELPASTEITVDETGKSTEEVLKKVVLETYDIHEDDERLRLSPGSFEKQRGHYPVRREFPVYSVTLGNSSPETMKRLKTFGFKTA